MLGLFRGKDDKPATIAAVPIFSRCSKNELEFLAAQMDEVQAVKGQVLTEQGQQGHSFYVIVSGAAEVTIAGEHRADLGQGDFFGEISMIDRGAATATVTATEPSTLLVMSHQQFRDAVKARENIALQVMEAMAARLRDNAAAGFAEGR